MKKLLTPVLVLGLLGQQSSAFAVTESITGETFAGYANSVLGKNGSFMTDLGNSGSTASWSSADADIAARITDTSAGSSITGTSTGAWIDLGFSKAIFNGTGNDLKLFFVGNNGHKVNVTVGGITNSYSLAAGNDATSPVTYGEGATGLFDTAYPTDPIIALPIDLATFAGLSGGSFSQIRLMIDNGYCDGPYASTIVSCPATAGPHSAVASFVGAYNVVPVPAAVWLFGSGLVALVSLVRKRA